MATRHLEICALRTFNARAMGTSPGSAVIQWHHGAMALTMVHLASQVRVAMAAEDLQAFADLLDSDITWGAPGANPGCKSRNQVLAWYQRGREGGVRGSVFDVEIIGDRLLVSMTVSGTESAQERGGTALRIRC